MSSMRFVVPILFAMAVAGCAPAPEEQVDLAAERDALLQADIDFSELSRQSGAPAAFTAFLTEDALGLPAGGQPTFYRDSLVAGLSDDYTLVWEPQRAEVAASGDMGWTWGRYQVHVTGSDGTETVAHGKYLNVWMKQADGSWKVVADVGNSNPQPGE